MRWPWQSDDDGEGVGSSAKRELHAARQKNREAVERLRNTASAAPISLAEAMGKIGGALDDRN